ncbi:MULTISPECIES: MFS transporter [unclassified Streptomyces]|uniref:MFS transporter n=1 Tax=unclassified Streptomyces TaxID=2593676 RepID=UPI0022549BD3|nr:MULTISPECIES: MFS transporter [unclassified Streptomyces]MCX4878163.1 MFS transporter [Streptomyces sp. NBC_00847]MCX5418162.1 MFS transporter [Streptomyces sp. NBC_00078]
MTQETGQAAARRRLPRGFHILLTAQTVSLVGSQVTLLALPLTAIQLLDAGPFETGVLLACGRAPYLLLGPLAGVLVDRLPHRILLITANTVMALALATVPLAALTGHIGLSHLYTVATLVGAATVLADVAFLACVPTVVPQSQLVQAQTRLELGQSAALALGPPLAGWLIAGFSAPSAILADTASFLVAVALLPYVTMERVPGAPTTAAPAGSRTLGPAHGMIRSVISEAAEGALFVLRTSRLRAVTLATGTLIFCYNAYSAVFLLHLTERLHLSAAATGTVTGIAAVGCVVGTLLAGPAARALGLGRVLVASLLASAVGAMLTPMFQVSGWLVWPAVGLSQFLLWTGQQVYNVHQVPIRYALTPPALHGRVNASIRTVVWSLAPMGALLGGACGAWFGTRTTLLGSGALIVAATAWIVKSPLWAVRTPQLAEMHSEPGSGTAHPTTPDEAAHRPRGEPDKRPS